MQTETTVTQPRRAERSRYQRAIVAAKRKLFRARGAAAVTLAAEALLAPSARAQQDGVAIPITARESRETNALDSFFSPKDIVQVSERTSTIQFFKRALI